MKHVFLVHSNITYFVAIEVIKLLKLTSEDVLFIIYRNYEIKEKKYKSFNIPPKVRVVKNGFKNYQKIQQFYQTSNEMIKENYHVYLPHTQHLEFALLVTNKKCLSYSYIEEGLASYVSSNFEIEALPIKEKLKYFLVYTSRFLVGFTLENAIFRDDFKKYRNSFALSEMSFQGVKDRIQLPFLGEKKKVGSYDCIIIFDALSIFGLIKIELILSFLEEIILPHILNKGFKSVAFKLHPEHNNSKDSVKYEIKKIREILNSQTFEVTELPLNFELEKYIQKYDVSIYSYVSSVGLYAKILGSPSYSLLRRITLLNPRIKISDEILSELTQI